MSVGLKNFLKGRQFLSFDGILRTWTITIFLLQRTRRYWDAFPLERNENFGAKKKNSLSDEEDLSARMSLITIYISDRDLGPFRVALNWAENFLELEDLIKWPSTSESKRFPWR